MKSGFKRTTAAILAALILASASVSIAVFSGVGTNVVLAEEIDNTGDTGGNTDTTHESWEECTECSAEHPHMISTAADLDKIRTHIHTGEDSNKTINGYFKLKNDIEFQNTDFEKDGTYYNGGLLFLPIGVTHTVNDEGKGYVTGRLTFCGVLDGDGHAISNIKQLVHNNGYNNGYGNFRWWTGCGLIGSLNGTLENLTLKNSSFNSGNGAGGMVCEESTKNAVVKNLTLENNFVETWGGWTYSGGMASYLKGSWNDVVVDGCHVNGYYENDFIAYNITDATLTNWTFKNCYYQDKTTNYNPFLFSMIEGTNVIDNLTFENNNQIKLNQIRYGIIAHDVKGDLTIKNSTFNIVTQNFNVNSSWASTGGLFRNSTQASHITFQNTYFGLQVPDNTNQNNLNKIAGIADIDDLNSKSENALFLFKKSDGTVIKEAYVDANGAHEALAADNYHWGANFTIGASGDAVEFKNSNPDVINVNNGGQATVLGFGNTTMCAAATIDGQEYKLFGGEKNISVTPANVSEAKVRMYIDSFSYTGSEIKPSIRVELDGVMLTEGIDYTVSYSDNVNVGTATATITGIDHYTGTQSVSFYIAQDKLPEIQVNDKEVTYSGKPQTIDVTSSNGMIQYDIEGTDVTDVSDAGVYYMTYKVVGSNGSTVASGGAYLTVNPALLTITADDKPTAGGKPIYVGDALPTYTYTVSGLVGDDTLTTEPTVACANADANQAGTYTITASGANAGENYSITYVDGTLTVSPRSSGGGGTVTPSEPEKPAVDQVQNVKAIKKSTTWLKLNFDKVDGVDGYEIYNAETNEKLADCTTQNGRAVPTKTVTGLEKGTTYKLQVKAYKLVDGERVYGDFSKVYTKATAYLDKVTGVRPIKKTQTTLKIQFNKVEGAERYKIFDADTGKVLCTVSTQSGAEVLKKTITGLKAGETRQYKVRAYATINSKNEYGEFSKTLVKATAE